ncbi:MAG: hypothetical protein ABII90_09805 [Bacteroidota bacterium]
MKKLKLLTTLAIVTVVLIAGCKKKDDVAPVNSTNSIVIPVQTTVHGTVSLVGASNFAVLSGSSVTSTGATTITGDLGLSPGSSVGGFPPGILNGTQHIKERRNKSVFHDKSKYFNCRG